jgi:hypothetical protein
MYKFFTFLLSFSYFLLGVCGEVLATLICLIRYNRQQTRFLSYGNIEESSIPHSNTMTKLNMLASQKVPGEAII